MHAVSKYQGILIVGPFVIISTLLLLLGMGLHQYPIAVSNEDTGFDMPMAGHVNVPEKLLATLNHDVFAVTTVKTKAEAQALYDTGKVKAFLSFPAELTEDMMIKADDPTYVLPAKIELQIAGDNPLAKVAAIGSLAKGFVPVVAESGGLSADSLPVPLDVGSLISGLQNAPNYLVSALLGFVCYALTGIFALFAGLALRKQGVDPKKAVGTGLNFLLGFAIAGTVLYLGLVTVAYLILGLTLTADLYIASSVILLLLLVSPAVALTASQHAPTPEHARPVIAFLILPLFLGGFLFPMELLPAWLQWLSYIFPPFYGIPAATAVEFQHSPASLPWDITIVAAFALVFSGLGIAGLGKEKKE